MRLTRMIADGRYRRHNASPNCKFMVWFSAKKGPPQRIAPHDVRRPAPVAPAIRNAKCERRLGGNYLARLAPNAVLAALIPTPDPKN